MSGICASLVPKTGRMRMPVGEILFAALPKTPAGKELTVQRPAFKD